MDDCRVHEDPAKYLSQVIRDKFFKMDCATIEKPLKDAALKYNDIKYSTEFQLEIPFFHSNCIAMDPALSPREKFNKIENLAMFYGETPEIEFALTLTLLEQGNLPGALQMAANYYYGPLELRPINATDTVKAIYAGHITTLCELAKTPQCFDSLNRFLKLHFSVYQRPAALNWGRAITEISAVKGGLK